MTAVAHSCAATLYPTDRGIHASTRALSDTAAEIIHCGRAWTSAAAQKCKTEYGDINDAENDVGCRIIGAMRANEEDALVIIPTGRQARQWRLEICVHDRNSSDGPFE